MTRLRRLFPAPSLAILTAFFAAPFLLVWVFSLRERGPYGGVLPTWTAENYLRLADGLYAHILWRTLAISLLATLLCIVLAFPLALFIARSSGGKRKLYLYLVILPFWTSFLARMYAWMFLLRDTGLINTALLGAGLIREPLPLLYNDGAVLLGLVYGYLPLRYCRSLLRSSAWTGICWKPPPIWARHRGRRCSAW